MRSRVSGLVSSRISILSCGFIRILSCLWLLSSFVGPAIADMGPKPTFRMRFQPPANRSYLTITAAKLFYWNSDEHRFDLFPEMGPQRFEVKPQKLFAMAYGFPKTLRIQVTLSDKKTYWTNPFETSGLATHFDLNLKGYSLVVTKSKPENGRWSGMPYYKRRAPKPKKPALSTGGSRP